MTNGNACVVMKSRCKHMFHYDCIKKEYLRTKISSCPECIFKNKNPEINQEIILENKNQI